MFKGLPGKGSDRPLIDAVNRKRDQKRELLARWKIDPTEMDFWTKLGQPPLMQMTLRGFASKSAAVIDLLIQWGETGVNPFQSRVDARHDKRAEFSYVSACITGLLRAVALADDLNFNPVTLIVFAEQTQPEMRSWYDRLVTHPDYSGTVTCRPWETDTTMLLVAPTANEVCAMLLRSVYLTLMPDKPVLFGSKGSLKNAVERIREHVVANKDDLQQRFDHVCKSMNMGEWLALIAKAVVERARLNIEHPKPAVEGQSEANAEPPKPVGPQEGGDEAGGGKGNAGGGQAKLRPCDIKAGSQYKLAIEDNPQLKTDRDAYDWYAENLADENEELPTFETWWKYLRNSRANSGSQKNQRGGGHETRSVVSGAKIEQQKRTEADFR